MRIRNSVAKHEKQESGVVTTPDSCFLLQKKFF